MQEQNKKTVQPSIPRTQGPAQNLQKNLTARQQDSQQQKMAIQQNTTQQPNVTNSHQKVVESQIEQKEKKDKKELNASLQKKLILSGFISMGISAVMFIVSIVLFLLIIFNTENSLLTSGIIFFVFAFIVGAVSVSLLLTSLKGKYNDSVANKNITKETNTPNMATKAPQSTMQPNASSIEKSASHTQHQIEKVGHSQKKAEQKEGKEKDTKKEKKISK